MKEKLLELVEVRKIIALLMALAFIYRILTDPAALKDEFVKNVILVVITFYFSKSTALDKPKE